MIIRNVLTYRNQNRDVWMFSGNQVLECFLESMKKEMMNDMKNYLLEFNVHLDTCMSVRVTCWNENELF